MLNIVLNNDQLGPLEVETDPEGLNDFEIELNRKKDIDGVFFEFALGLRFVKEARDYISKVYNLEGIEGVITVELFETVPNQYSSRLVYTGQIRLSDYQIDENFVDGNIEESGFKRSFLNATDIEVNLDSDTTLKGEAITPLAKRSIELPGKTILKVAELQPKDFEPFEIQSIANITGDDIDDAAGNIIIQGNLYIDTSNQIKNDFDLNRDVYGFSNFNASPIAIPFLIIGPEDVGSYTFDLQVLHAITVSVNNTGSGDVDVIVDGNQDGTALPPVKVRAFFQIRDVNGVARERILLLDKEAYDGNDSRLITVGFLEDLSLNQTFDLQEGDEVSFFYQLLITSPATYTGSPNLQYDVEIEALEVTQTQPGKFFKFNFEGNTLFQASQVNQYLLFEVFDYCVKFLTDNKASLKSQVLGRTDTGQSQDGKAALYSITLGWFLRQINENKSLFITWQDLFESISAIFCLGWGFETDQQGNNFVVVEEKTYFYNKNNQIKEFNNFTDPKIKAQKELYYKKVIAGYPELEDIAISGGIDEFNTQRTYVSPISQTDKELSLLSVFRASSYEIETQRRFAALTEDSKLDDELFIIELKRDSPSAFSVKTGADFSETISNIIDPDTAFNVGLRPSEFIKNWSPVLSSTVFFGLDKTFKFASGRGNYALTVGSESERRDFILDPKNAIWVNEYITFEVPFEANDRIQVIENLFGYIRITDRNNNRIDGYVKNIKNVKESKKAEVTILRVNR
jgi:hypothetical protein